MRLLRGIAGALLWIVSALVGLVGVILCITIVLLPVGLPLLGYAGRLFTLSLKLMLPRAVSHPVEAADESIRKRGRGGKREMSTAAQGAKRIHRRTNKKARGFRKKALVSEPVQTRRYRRALIR
jgi:hypothetical protein